MLTEAFTEFLQSLTAPPAQTEAEYYQAWLSHVGGGADPLQMAWQGGLLADRFGFIFSAGYQAALRQIFPHLDQRGWSAFAVSEDRQPQDPLPGVRYVQRSDGYLLSGHKTWIAASACCRQLIVSARGEGDTLYFAIDADRPEVEVHTRAPGRMLPDLSQGQAQLRDYPAAQPLDASRVQSFAAAEVFYIYIAFLASTWRAYPARRGVVEACLTQAEQLSQRALPAWDAAQLALDEAVQALVKSMRSVEGEADDLWRRDYKLITMYARSR